MKKIYLVLAVLTIMSVSCTDNDNIVDSSIPETNAPIVNTPTGANVGEIMVKFKPEISGMLDKAQTRAIGGVMTRSGLPSMDEVLDVIGTYKFERIFPVDQRHETRTRETGLHLWYMVHFNKNVELSKVAEDLAKIGEIAQIEYSHNIQRAYDPKIKPTFVSQQAIKRMAATRSSRSAVFNDEGLKHQWGYINDGAAFNDDMNKWGDHVVPPAAGIDVGCDVAWGMCSGDPSVIVAVLDEGVAWDHPDLKQNMWVNDPEIYASKEDADGNGYTGDRYGYNFVSDMGFISYDGATDTGHGTHVAGTIAAVNNNGIGVCGIAGGNGDPNSGVKIMSCQVFSGDKGVTIYQEAKAIKYAADNGAVVLQCSWGLNSGLANPLTYIPGYTSEEEFVKSAPLEREVLDYFIHNAGSPNGVIEGGIAVFAGGNEYAAMAGYPGAYSGCVSVSAVAADGTPASYTNYGPGINIAAPGGDSDYHKCDEGKIYSTLPPSICADPTNPYGYMEGTSMACPHVSGVIALGLSYAVQKHRHFRAEDFKTLVFESVDDVYGYFQDTKTYWLNYGYVGQVTPIQMEPSNYRNKMGTGLINAGKLLQAVATGGVEISVPNVYLSVNSITKINFSKYFKNGNDLSFTCTVADNTIVKLEKNAKDHKEFTITGLKIGAVKVSVKASNNETQEFYITVRKGASGSGWL
ncbi:S8 family peptidase [Bacteroides xylanisolvens]|uniref:S8 family peptidase n=1 Tax=Bacteroides xylanisolvens TaxID=371601 RepID=UPI001898E596|nr:S8 family serine peptidase [Bacteroides xylanisolvens]